VLVEAADFKRIRGSVPGGSGGRGVEGRGPSTRVAVAGAVDVGVGAVDGGLEREPRLSLSTTIALFGSPRQVK